MVQIISIVVLIFSVIIHELAHGWIADKFGDPTPRMAGRLTWNPIPHIDPVGSILVPGILLITGAHFFIGWAKAVPINPSNFQNPSRHMMWVALAGPLSNISILTIGVLILKGVLATTSGSSIVVSAVISFLIILIQTNMVLALFNLMPIPPLDGSRIVANFIPPAAQDMMYKYEGYGMLLIIAGAYFGFFSPIFDLGFQLLQRVIL